MANLFRWLRVKLEFVAYGCRPLGKLRGALNGLDVLKRMHGFRSHPGNPPLAGIRNGCFSGGNVADATICKVIAEVRRAAARIPVQEYARPTMVMHGFGRAWRQRHL